MNSREAADRLREMATAFEECGEGAKVEESLVNLFLFRQYQAEGKMEKARELVRKTLGEELQDECLVSFEGAVELLLKSAARFQERAAKLFREGRSGGEIFAAIAISRVKNARTIKELARQKKFCEARAEFAFVYGGWIE